MRTGPLETQLSMDAALERAEAWVERAERWFGSVRPGVDFTADDLRDLVGDPPAHGDAMGAVFRKAHRSGLITCSGFTTSTRPDAHGRALRTWRRL